MSPQPARFRPLVGRTASLLPAVVLMLLHAAGWAVPPEPLHLRGIQDGADYDSLIQPLVLALAGLPVEGGWAVGPVGPTRDLMGVAAHAIRPVPAAQRIKSFRRAWATACRNAGLAGKTPHDFRRTAVRNLEGAGVPRSVAMEMVGHRTESIYRRYAIADEAMLREGAVKLAALDAAEEQTPRTVVPIREAQSGRTGRV